MAIYYHCSSSWLFFLPPSIVTTIHPSPPATTTILGSNANTLHKGSALATPLHRVVLLGHRAYTALNSQSRASFETRAQRVSAWDRARTPSRGASTPTSFLSRIYTDIGGSYGHTRRTLRARNICAAHRTLFGGWLAVIRFRLAIRQRAATTSRSDQQGSHAGAQ